VEHWLDWPRGHRDHRRRTSPDSWPPERAVRYAIIVSVETFSRGTSGAALEPWFVTGFVQGAGTFTYSRSDRNIALYFAIGRPEEDAELLTRVQTFFGGAGRVYAVRTGSSVSRRYLRIARVDELARVVDHFERYPLQGAKGKTFEIWSEMVRLKQLIRKPDRKLLGDLAQELSAFTSRSADWKSSSSES
jgi:hypothetical protein